MDQEIGRLILMVYQSLMLANDIRIGLLQRHEIYHTNSLQRCAYCWCYTSQIILLQSSILLQAAAAHCNSSVLLIALARDSRVKKSQYPSPYGVIYVHLSKLNATDMRLITDVLSVILSSCRTDVATLIVLTLCGVIIYTVPHFGKAKDADLRRTRVVGASSGFWLSELQARLLWTSNGVSMLYKAYGEVLRSS